MFVGIILSLLIVGLFSIISVKLKELEKMKEQEQFTEEVIRANENISIRKMD